MPLSAQDKMVLGNSENTFNGLGKSDVITFHRDEGGRIHNVGERVIAVVEDAPIGKLVAIRSLTAKQTEELMSGTPMQKIVSNGLGSNPVETVNHEAMLGLTVRPSTYFAEEPKKKPA